MTKCCSYHWCPSVFFFRACYWSCSHHTVLIRCLLLSSHYSFQFMLSSAFHVLVLYFSSAAPLTSFISIFSRHSPNKLHSKETHHKKTQQQTLAVLTFTNRCWIQCFLVVQCPAEGSWVSWIPLVSVQWTNYLPGRSYRRRHPWVNYIV